MCAYNKINGEYACENENTLNKDLRERLGFNGYVMSDWGAMEKEADPKLYKGMDQE
jgi:beta-glucosidase